VSVDYQQGNYFTITISQATSITTNRIVVSSFHHDRQDELLFKQLQARLRPLRRFKTGNKKKSPGFSGAITAII
jgi:hypothetical protein